MDTASEFKGIVVVLRHVLANHTDKTVLDTISL